MTLDTFISTYSGLSNVGDTSQNIGQCVGLIEVWTDSLNLPHTWGNACDLLKDADPNSFDIILNSPTAVPQAGDIMVWNAQFNGTVGHTGIATGKADTNNFECFEQNDPIGSNPHIKEYSYYCVDGWLHPKVVIQSNQPTMTDDQTRALQVITNFYTSNGSQGNLEGTARALVGDHQTAINDQGTIKGLQDEVTLKEGSITVLQSQITDLTNNLSNALAANKQQADMIDSLRKQIPSPSSSVSFWTTIRNFFHF